MPEKPFSNECEICHKEVKDDDDWADIGPPDRVTGTAHFECLGLGFIKAHFQKSLEDAVKKAKEGK